jgi:hypothetical protein
MSPEEWSEQSSRAATKRHRQDRVDIAVREVEAIKAQRVAEARLVALRADAPSFSDDGAPQPPHPPADAEVAALLGAAVPVAELRAAAGKTPLHVA